jgi:hypothetical protein
MPYLLVRAWLVFAQTKAPNNVFVAFYLLTNDQTQ